MLLFDRLCLVFILVFQMQWDELPCEKILSAHFYFFCWGEIAEFYCAPDLIC